MEYIEHNYKNKEDYGTYFFSSDGSVMGRLYGFYNDDSYMVLDCLSVDEKFRNKGLGTKMQELREERAMSMGCKYVFLWVIDGSWMQEWYKRRGYVTKNTFENEKGRVWMRKELI